MALFFTIYTSDMPFMEDVTVATYADDAALIANDDCPTEASNVIQNYLDSIAIWLKIWNNCFNTDKSVNIILV